LAVVPTVLWIVYPLLIVWALPRFEPRIVASTVLALLVLRGVLLVRRRRDRPQTRAFRPFFLPVVLVASVSVATAVWNDALGLLLAPTFVNAALFAAFALSLRHEPIVETLARLQVDRLAPAEIRYCRRVTEIWCGFFALNGSIALALALNRALDAWVFYTGFLSYCLMGALFAAEYVYRHARFRRYEGAPTDPFLIRLFPPRQGFDLVRIDARADGRSRVVSLEVPTGLACWRGHFPGQPMLPGVLQVEWTLSEIERWWGARPQLSGLEALKFKRPVLPGDSLQLELVALGSAGSRAAGVALAGDEPTEEVEFCFRRGGQEISRGRVHCSRRATGGPRELGDPIRTDASTPRAGEQPPQRRLEAWPDPGLVLTHAAPMLWLGRIEAHDAKETHCLVDVSDLGSFLDPDGRCGAQVALEWMAQCVAAHAGLERRARGKAPSLGLLLGSKRVRFARPDYDRGDRFRVVAVRGWGGEQGAVSFDCRVETIDSGERVADARLACFVPGAESGDSISRVPLESEEASLEQSLEAGGRIR